MGKLKYLGISLLIGLCLGGIIRAYNPSLPVLPITQIVTSYENPTGLFSLSGNIISLNSGFELNVSKIHAVQGIISKLNTDELCLNGNCISDFSSIQGLWENYLDGIKPKDNKRIYATGGINITLNNIELLSTKKDYVEIIIEGNNPTCPAECQELERYWLSKTCNPSHSSCYLNNIEPLSTKKDYVGITSSEGCMRVSTTSCYTQEGWNSTVPSCTYRDGGLGVCIDNEGPHSPECVYKICYADSWSKVKCRCPIYYVQVNNLTVNGTLCLDGKCIDGTTVKELVEAVRGYEIKILQSDFSTSSTLPVNVISITPAAGKLALVYVTGTVGVYGSSANYVTIRICARLVDSNGNELARSCYREYERDWGHSVEVNNDVPISLIGLLNNPDGSISVTLQVWIEYAGGKDVSNPAGYVRAGTRIGYITFK